MLLDSDIFYFHFFREEKRNIFSLMEACLFVDFVLLKFLFKGFSCAIYHTSLLEAGFTLCKFLYFYTGNFLRFDKRIFQKQLFREVATGSAL